MVFGRFLGLNHPANPKVFAKSSDTTLQCDVLLQPTMRIARFQRLRWDQKLAICAVRCASQNSAVPKRGRSKRGRTQKHANVRKRAQMNAKGCKRKSAKERKRAQKSAKQRFRVKNCKQPGLKQPRLGTSKVCGAMHFHCDLRSCCRNPL